MVSTDEELEISEDVTAVEHFGAPIFSHWKQARRLTLMAAVKRPFQLEMIF
jgi:hypothetical protein